MSTTTSHIEVNPKVKAAQYAVRGAIAARAQAIQDDLAAGKGGYTFSEVIYCNIGNPQQLDQKPLTFFRQVNALVDAPFLLENEAILSQFPSDAVDRARQFIKAVGGPNKTGAYTPSQGVAMVRRRVADFITERDRKGASDPELPEANPNQIFLTDGASTGIKLTMQVLLGVTENDAMMLPVPQYPLYSAMLPVVGAHKAPYKLEESSGWTLTRENLEASFTESVARGHIPRLLVVINPGNPTGQVLEENTIAEILEFAYEKKIALIADEVYQENVYAEGKQFHSFREKLLSHPNEAIRTGVPLVSLHTTSKGIIGECGRRGGYAEYINFPESVFTEVVKLVSMMLCSNVNGQLMLDLMVRPPREGEPSYESYCAEYNALFASLKRRAKLLEEQLNSIPGMKCNPVEGAMYAFPRLFLPEKFVMEVELNNKATGLNQAADFVWCMKLMEKTGIVVVPGSGFGQEEGTFHFRTTILPQEPLMELMMKRMKEFQEELHRQYA